VTPSIRLSLLKWLIAPILLINLIGAGLTYRLAWTPTQIAFDQNLADTAWALAPRLKEVDRSIEIDLPLQVEQVLRIDRFDVIYFTVRNAEQATIAGDRDFPALAPAEGWDEPAAYDGSMRGEPVRIIVLKTRIEDRPVFIGVAETLRKRTNARSVILVFLFGLESLLTLVSIGIVWLAVAKGLLPLEKMRQGLNARTRDDFSPVSADNIPLELRPVVDAINGLLGKAQTGASARQDFLANVAHQLRTPLAGLKIQLELMQQRHASDPEAARSAAGMLSATERMIRQTNQLLALARAEPTHFAQARLEAVDLDKLVEESIQHFVEQSQRKNIDLGFDLQPTRVMGDRFLLRDMIDNLIDNAIRYSPPDGTVTVSCVQNAGQGVFSVEDSGPGISPHEQSRIFDRFYRIGNSTSGNGLGLAIVRDIVKDHGAQIVLTSGERGKGTAFSVLFPVQ
jgi:two-component system sensor histidine kinase TctE